MNRFKHRHGLPMVSTKCMSASLRRRSNTRASAASISLFRPPTTVPSTCPSTAAIASLHCGRQCRSRLWGDPWVRHCLRESCRDREKARAGRGGVPSLLLHGPSHPHATAYTHTHRGRALLPPSRNEFKVSVRNSPRHAAHYRRLELAYLSCWQSVLLTTSALSFRQSSYSLPAPCRLQHTHTHTRMANNTQRIKFGGRTPRHKPSRSTAQGWCRQRRAGRHARTGTPADAHFCVSPFERHVLIASGQRQVTATRQAFQQSHNDDNQ